MYKYIGTVLAMTLAVCVQARETRQMEAALTTLKDQFVAMEIAGWRGKAEHVKELLDTQREDGRWPNVDYACQNTSSWKTAQHVDNLKYLSYWWRQTHDEATEKALHRALKFWLEGNFRNPNWWWNAIGVPQVLAIAALSAEACLSESEIKDVCKALQHIGIDGTGQNRVWVTRIVMMRGMLANDAGLVKQAVEVISAEIRLSDQEGIRPDWCFHQHGHQPQFGNYGLSFIATMTRFAIILHGTPFEFSSEKLELLRHLLADGYAWTIWNGYMDVSCLGRLLVKDAQQRRGRAAVAILKDFREGVSEIPVDGPWGFKYFFKSAYAVYRNKEYSWMASIRMATPDVIGVETWINGDAVNGGHMADGALYVYATGKEYENIFPLWNNWRLIPGITTYLNLPPVTKPPYGYDHGANAVDDITVKEGNGITELSFMLKREGLTVRKTWAFSPDGVLAIGEGITSTHETADVVTCVEQSLAQPNAKIYPYENGCLRAVNGDFDYRIEAPEAAIAAGVEERSGTYRSVMSGESEQMITGKVFSVYIRHGVKPLGASYRYRILRVPAREF